MAVLQFVFSSFWVWLGSALMLAIVTGALATGLSQARGILYFRQDLTR